MFHAVCGYLSKTNDKDFDQFTREWYEWAYERFVQGPRRTPDEHGELVDELRHQVQIVLEIMDPAAAGRAFFEQLGRIIGVELRAPVPAPSIRPKIEAAFESMVVGGYVIAPTEALVVGRPGPVRMIGIRPPGYNQCSAACLTLRDALAHVELQLSLAAAGEWIIERRDGDGIPVQYYHSCATCWSWSDDREQAKRYSDKAAAEKSAGMFTDLITVVVPAGERVGQSA